MSRHLDGDERLDRLLKIAPLGSDSHSYSNSYPHFSYRLNSNPHTSFHCVDRLIFVDFENGEALDKPLIEQI